MEWEEIGKQMDKLKRTRYVIKNSSTGQFLCDSRGEIKIFYDLREAKTYIRIKMLSSIYYICPCEESNNV